MTSKTTSTSAVIAFLLLLHGATTSNAYYNPSSGRFLSRDPIMYPDGANTYAAWYVPASVDPDGKQAAGDDDWTPPVGRRIWPPEWPVCDQSGGDWECAGDPGLAVDDGIGGDPVFPFQGMCGSFQSTVNAVAIGPVADDSWLATEGEILRRTNAILSKRFPITYAVNSNCDGTCCPLVTINSNRDVTLKVGAKVNAGNPIGIITLSLQVKVTLVASGTLGVCVPKGCSCPPPIGTVDLSGSLDLSGFTIDLGQVN